MEAVIGIITGVVIVVLFWGGHIFFAKKMLKEAKQRDVNYRLWLALCIIGGICPLISMSLIYLLYAIFTNKKKVLTFCIAIIKPFLVFAPIAKTLIQKY